MFTSDFIYKIERLEGCALAKNHFFSFSTLLSLFSLEFHQLCQILNSSPQFFSICSNNDQRNPINHHNYQLTYRQNILKPLFSLLSFIYIYILTFIFMLKNSKILFIQEDIKNKSIIKINTIVKFENMRVNVFIAHRYLSCFPSNHCVNQFLKLKIFFCVILCRTL